MNNFRPHSEYNHSSLVGLDDEENVLWIVSEILMYQSAFKGAAAPGTTPPQSNFFHFHAVFGNI